jgi:hypothetical protein
MLKFFPGLEGLFFKKIDARGLAIFRIAYVLVLFCELNQLSTFAPVIYDPVPYLVPSEFRFSLTFFFWKIILLLIGIGLFTRFATVVNFILSIIIFHSFVRYEYHVFYSYVAVNVLLLFMPVSKMWSIDSVIEKVKARLGKEWITPETKVYAINYLFPVFSVIGLVYFDSVFYKFTSPMWMKGLGMWLPANLPIASWNEHVIISNMEWLVKSMGYLVLIFETVFIFLIWFKPFRIPLLIIGMGLHIGILIEFPIPWFALAACGVYLLMVPVWVWRFFGFKPASNPFIVYYDDNFLVYNRLAVLVKSFDAFNRIELIPKSNLPDTSEGKNSQSGFFGVNPNGQVQQGFDAFTAILKNLLWTFPLFVLLKIPGLSQVFGLAFKWASSRLDRSDLAESGQKPEVKRNYNVFFAGWNKVALTKFAWLALFFIHVYLQFMVSLTSELSILFYKNTGFFQSKYFPVLKQISEKHGGVGLAFFGITHHPVFMDFHFHGYNHVLKVTYENANGTETTLPLINDKGMPDRYVRGAFWVNYTFHTSNAHFTWGRYLSGTSRYARFWLQSQGLSATEPRKFKVYVAKMVVPNHWEKDFLHNSINALKWQPAADFVIDGKKEEYHKIVENLEAF